MHDGSEIWNLKLKNVNKIKYKKYPLFSIKKNIYFNNSIGDVTALDIKSGQLSRQLPTPNNDIRQTAFLLSNSELVINENSIFFSNNKNAFYSINLQTGFANWITEISSDLKPVIIGNLVILYLKKDIWL
ncbi:PQQ-binding-like beta-propeller repeat protein [Candidatus Pelagibacter sp. Uisw_114]